MSDAKEWLVARTGSGSYEFAAPSRHIVGLRWAANGRLEYCQEETFQRWNNGSLVEVGTREAWHYVEFVSPNAAPSATPNPEGHHGS